MEVTLRLESKRVDEFENMSDEVLAALAVPAIFEHFWEQGREEEQARKEKKD